MNRTIKMSVVSQLAIAASGVLWAVSAGPAFAANDSGISDKEILVCAYQPETGNESSYFRMGKGADAWFKHVNEAGGIGGRMINFEMVDDGYQPARTRVIVEQFIKRDKCFAIVAALGSAPTVAVIDYVTEGNMPLIGPGTGAQKVVTFPSKWVFPLYPSYEDEGRQLTHFASEVFKAKKVAVLYQNDPSGKSHIAGIDSVKDKYGIEVVAEKGYDPKDIDVSSQVIAMKDANPDAVICSCAPEPAAKFYTERKRLGWNVPVVNVFFGKSPKVPELAGNDAVEGVYFSTIFRDFDSPAPQIKEAKEILAKYYPQEQPDPIHLWGFTGAQVFTEAMKRMTEAGGDITRDRLVETLEGIKNWTGSVVPNITIDKGEAPQHFLVKELSFVQFKSGKFEEFTPPWATK
jgi:branched-chain amino acid transport system substrate-binding protein